MTNSSRKEKRLNPFLFQGAQETKGYFEGWYFKQVNASHSQTISVIFGVSMNVENAHSFVQLLLTKPVRSYYFEYPVSAFISEDEGYRIGPNTFCLNSIQMDLHQDDFECVGKLDFTQHTPLRSTLYMPSIMGPFAYITGMECNHGVVSMRHKVDGTLILNDEAWSFQEDIGYIEKDWGRSFPKRYIWIQGNHFSTNSTNLMVSVADIPFLGLAFEGIIAQLEIAGKVYRIASYLGARRGKLLVTKQGFNLEIFQGKLRLFVEAKMDDTGLLKAPHMGSMLNTIKEGLGGKVTVRLSKAGEIIWEDTSNYCGIEIEGYK